MIVIASTEISGERPSRQGQMEGRTKDGSEGSSPLKRCFLSPAHRL